MALTPNYINHIALVLDASGSMSSLKEKVIAVADAQIAHLAARSKELDQETRVSVYTFDDTVKCLIFDKDVLRLPSIKSLYQIDGMTALIDGTLKALEDLSDTSTLYGDHAFLTYVLTDGGENRSRKSSADLAKQLNTLEENWTVAVFVPNQSGMYEAKKFGFPAQNIEVWDATSQRGMEMAGERIRQTTDTFMSLRSSGVRGSRNLFSLDTQALTKTAVAQTLTALGPGQFRCFAVKKDTPIAQFIEGKLNRPYRLGEAYYQLTKSETIQPQKQIALMDKKSYKVYVGKEARTLLGLPNHEVKVSPASHPNFTLFVQSTSVNRKLIKGTEVLLLS